MSGPLAGVRIIELAGIGPTPHAAMLLGDWGADVVRVVRPTATGDPADANNDTQLRNRTLIAANLKNPQQVADLLDLIEYADVLMEGFRPGVTERLGLGPDECLARNPRLIYARMTGWGQDGPLARTAGHDLNYISVTGILAAIGTREDPVIPLNLLGDFGGGSMFLVAGILAALHERHASGCGQVIDAAIIDGVSQLAHTVWAFRNMGLWREQRSSNILDGGTPWYSLYRCADGQHVAVAALEEPFYAALLDGLGFEANQIPQRLDQESWPLLRTLFAERFATASRDYWAAIFDGTDACVTPVLTMTEALAHPQLRNRDVLLNHAGTVQPMPAPRFSRSGSGQQREPGSVVGDLVNQRRVWSALAKTHE